MVDIFFKRLGTINANGSIPGELTIGKVTWPTIEREREYTFVRKGVYQLIMVKKVSGRPVRCLSFYENRAISMHLIHDAQNDNHKLLTGCISPGLKKGGHGIKDSAKAMEEIWKALGDYKEYRKCTIDVQNNIRGNETKAEWIARRIREGYPK